MKYEIIGGQLPAVSCVLNKGEKLFTESGGMSWMDDAFSMESNTRGGLMKGIGRAFSGESIFLTTYECLKDDSNIVFGSCFPGKILPIELGAGEELILQKSAFLAGTNEMEIKAHLNKKIGSGLFGGEGFILQKLIGPGTAFLEIDGDVVEKTLAPGEKIKVDQGYLAAFEPSVEYSIETIKGLKNVLFSGEGMFITTLCGPGKVWLQTMPFNVVANRIVGLIPSK